MPVVLKDIDITDSHAPQAGEPGPAPDGTVEIGPVMIGSGGSGAEAASSGGGVQISEIAVNLSEPASGEQLAGGDLHPNPYGQGGDGGEGPASPADPGAGDLHPNPYGDPGDGGDELPANPYGEGPGGSDGAPELPPNPYGDEGGGDLHPSPYEGDGGSAGGGDAGGGDSGNGNGGDSGGGGDPDGGSGGGEGTPDPDGSGGEAGESGGRGGAGTHGGGAGAAGEAGPSGDIIGHLGGESHGRSGTGPLHDPGEERPNPDDSGSGGPTSSVAHAGASLELSFWDQAEGAVHGATSGGHAANADIGGLGLGHLTEGHAAAMDTTASHASFDLAGGFEHAVAPDAALAHDVSGASAHAEFGASAFHAAAELNSAHFANQMHI
ncbi:hypothetical protein [Bradyrhizobium sp. STM 3809]|uniref:hypothetical protein n=1 Tax=Bradyrhizobium sp. STM 3809 TaxID=551936 RepID=UPI00024088F8|nr:hypothetical protein [Bradyrhizobium sp. STM 3809]CCE00592.1 conserved hypothetical protein [Bradyrhizobium sp. STM 3809]